MKMIALAAVAATIFFVSPYQVQAQVGEAHFKAWDRHEGAPRAARPSVRKAKRVVRVIPRKAPRSIQARLSPPVAKTLPAQVVNTVEDVATSAVKSAEDAAIGVAGAVVKSPFGVLVNLFASRSGIPDDVGRFLSRVQRDCGRVTVISTIRRGARIAGSRIMSCHAIGQAVDYQVADPACALRLARTVRLGHSVDYYGVRALYGRGMPVHYHVSNCRQEMGAKFVHGGGRAYARKKAKTRYAKRYKKVRYAAVRR